VAGRLGRTPPEDDRVATLAVRGTPVVVAPPGLVARGAERLRSGLRAAVDGAPPDARGLLPGLVIGDTSRTPDDLTEAMRATGMTHLTAVSGSNVAVVECIKRIAEFFEKLKGHPGSILCVLNGLRAVVPRPDSCARAKGIGALSAEGMPIDDAKPQMVAHRFAFDFFVGIVIPKGEGILALGTLERDTFDFGKGSHGSVSLLLVQPISSPVLSQ